jgi:hypothetical protein
VFGIWGTGGPHETLAFRVEEGCKRSNRDELPCFQNRTTEQLMQFLGDNGVYMASKKEAEGTLRQQLKTGGPQWDTYGRWKFPESVQSYVDSFGDGVDAYCAACYNGEPRCKNNFRLRKLVLRPLQHREFRVRLSLCSSILLTNLSGPCI